MKIGLIAFLCLATTGKAHADEVNNGGRFARDEHNPWFLGNVKNVSYCIEVDETSFGTTLDEVRASVKMGLKFWQEAFKSTELPESPATAEPKEFLQIASQQFKERPCDEAIDLRFQFGVLHQEQRSFLNNPQDFVAVTIRTAYDRSNLRGKGFIYFSPETGELRPTMQRFANNPWSTCRGCLLRGVIYHELGHVFGLPHDFGYIMDARLPESLTHESHVKAIAEAPALWERIDYSMLHSNPFGFPAPTIHFLCEEPDNGYRPARFDFFGSPSGHLCMELDIFDFIEDEIQIRTGADPNGELTPLGVIRLRKENIRNEKIGDSVRIWITPEQKVFTTLPEQLLDYDYLSGPSGYQHREYRGYFQSFGSSPVRKDVFVIISPNSELRIGGVHNGSLVSDLFLGRIEPIVPPLK